MNVLNDFQQRLNTLINEPPHKDSKLNKYREKKISIINNIISNLVKLDIVEKEQNDKDRK